MKKTILAIAIPALFASAAHAATTVYDKDGTTFDIYGRVQVNYYGDHDGEDSTLLGQSRFGWSGKTALNSTWSGIAKTEWQVAAENTDGNSKFKARHIYAGFDGSQYGKIIFGQTDTAYYDGVLEKTDVDLEWGSEANKYDGRQEGQVKYMGKWGGLFANASYQSSDTDTKKIDHGYAAGVGYDFDFGLGLAAGGEIKNYSDTASLTGTDANKDKKTDWAAAASYTVGGFYFAGMYNQSEQEYTTTSDKWKFRGYEFMAQYTLDAWTFSTGYNFGETQKATETSYTDSAEYTYIGAQYAFTPKLKSWAEYRISGLSNEDDQWTVALQYNF